MRPREPVSCPRPRSPTQAEVDAIPHSTDGKQVIWWSTELDHFGVRAGAREKTFVVGQRVNKQWKLATLGRAGEITVQKAIRDAKQVLGEMVGGIDPVARERDADRWRHDAASRRGSCTSRR